MLPSEMKQMIKWRLRNNSSSTLDSMIETFTKYVQKEKLEKADFQPWFLLSDLVQTTNTANDRRLSVPTDFLMEWEKGTLWIYDATATDDPWVEIVKKDFDRALEVYPGTGRPMYYDLQGNYFLLVPQPVEVYTFKMKYFRKEPDPDFTGDTENNWFAEAGSWLMGEVGAIIAGDVLSDLAVAQSFMADATKGKNDLFVQHIAREEANRIRTMGED